eukprot:s48_g18.t1
MDAKKTMSKWVDSMDPMAAVLRWLGSIPDSLGRAILAPPANFGHDRENLRTGDLIKIMTVCGASGEEDQPGPKLFVGHHRHHGGKSAT